MHLEAHNIYTDGVQNGVYRNNILMRASSIGTKLQGNTGINGMLVDDNLYIDGEIAIESCNNYHNNHYRVHSPVISNNVIYEIGRSNPTLRDVGWGMWIQGWYGGRIRNNLLISHQGQMFFNLGLRSRGIEIDNNVGLVSSLSGICHTSEVELADMKIHDNYFEKISDNSNRMIISEGASLNGINFSRNGYFCSKSPEFRINSISFDKSQWIATFEPDAIFSKRSFYDDSRTVETYMQSIGEDASLDRFFAMCRMQERYHWDIMKRKSYKTGEHVEWDTPQGITEGDIEEEVTSRTHIKKHTVAASQKDPQYKVRSSKSGKIAIHRPEELRRKKKAH